MSAEKQSQFFEKIGELCAQFRNAVIIWVILRIVLSVPDWFPSATRLVEPLRPALNIAPVAWLVQLLTIVKYTSLLDALLNIAFFIILFYLTLHILTGAVFPIRSWRDAWKARVFMLKTSHLQTPQPVIRASNGTHKVYVGNPDRALGPGIVISDGVTALALEKKNKFTRVLGPGFHFLDLEERVQATIDLRPQSLRRTVTVSTREGIEVEIDLSVNTEIQRGRDWTSDYAGYPYWDESVYKAVYAERSHLSEETATSPQPRSAADWCETIATVCEDSLRHIVAGYTLDQLLAVDNPDVNPRQDIAKQLVAVASEQVGRYGGNLRSTSISHVRPPRAVLEQRIQNWLADWQRRERTLRALGDARRIQLEESARALAQTEILQSLGETLALQSETQSIELLSLRLLEALERMAREPGTGAQLDAGMMEFLHKLSELFNPKPPEGTT